MVNLVDVRDVARALVRLGQVSEAPARTLLVGANVLLHDFLSRLARRYGVPAPSPPLKPAAAARLADSEERRVEGTRERPSLSREIADLTIHAVEVRADLAERALGMRWTPLNDTLDAFDAWARRMRIIPRPDTTAEELFA